MTSTPPVLGTRYDLRCRAALAIELESRRMKRTDHHQDTLRRPAHAEQHRQWCDRGAQRSWSKPWWIRCIARCRPAILKRSHKLTEFLIGEHCALCRIRL